MLRTLYNDIAVYNDYESKVGRVAMRIAPHINFPSIDGAWQTLLVLLYTTGGSGGGYRLEVGAR